MRSHQRKGVPLCVRTSTRHHQPSMHNRQPSKELKQPPTEPREKKRINFFFKRKVQDFQSVTERISHNSITSFGIDAAHTLNKAHRSATQIASVSEARTRTKPATKTRAMASGVIVQDTPSQCLLLSRRRCSMKTRSYCYRTAPTAAPKRRGHPYNGMGKRRAVRRK